MERFRLTSVLALPSALTQRLATDGAKCAQMPIVLTQVTFVVMNHSRGGPI